MTLQCLPVGYVMLLFDEEEEERKKVEISLGIYHQLCHSFPPIPLARPLQRG